MRGLSFLWLGALVGIVLASALSFVASSLAPVTTWTMGAQFLGL